MDTNMDNRRVHILQLGTPAPNMVSVTGLSIFIYAIIENIRRSYAAREFLSGIQAVVWCPYRDIWICTLLLALLADNMFVRDRLFPDNSEVILFNLVVNFVICFAIITLLDFNYDGIPLLMFSNIILYAKSGKSKYFLVAVIIDSLILADYELLSISYHLYSIQDYISFYNAPAQQYLPSSYNILVSLSIIMFVAYCMNTINQQQENLDEIHAFNEQLQDVNEQFQEYSVMVEKATEAQERSRLAREIHDTLGHTPAFYTYLRAHETPFR